MEDHLQHREGGPEAVCGQWGEHDLGSSSRSGAASEPDPGNLAVPLTSKHKKAKDFFNGRRLGGEGADNGFRTARPVMRRLALEAGARILEVYNGPSFDVRAKSDASPVTEADEAADALISAGLRDAFPDVVLVTEEQAESHALSARTFLIVDPLDGTKEFVQRRGELHSEHRLCRGWRASARRGLRPRPGSALLHDRPRSFGGGGRAA